MYKLHQIFFFLVLTLSLSSCATIFYSPDARQLAEKHKIIAVLPPSISIAAQKKIDAEALKEQQKTESLNFQHEIYKWLLKRKMQNRISVEILDIETTNSKLRKSDYPNTVLTPNELCELLGVDAVINSSFSMSKPMSEGGAIALGLLVGAYGATNQVGVSMGIHDGNAKKLIWNYSHKFSGGLGSTPSQLVDGLMRQASKKMPYATHSN